MPYSAGIIVENEIISDVSEIGPSLMDKRQKRSARIYEREKKKE
jgi:hypothetical protein